MSRFRGVLFDWRGTLFHDEPDADWFRASAALLGRTLSDADVTTLLEGMARAEDDPRVAEARRTADCSVEQNRAAADVLFEVAGVDAALPTAPGDGPRGLDLALTLVGV